MVALLKRIFGSANDRILSKYYKEIKNINDLEVEISKLSDDELKLKTKKFQAMLKDNIASKADIKHEAFAVVREASKRVLGMRHFDVQLVGGLILNDSKIAEMRTGEGKTLVATLPAYLNALYMKGVHVVTVNDYLATRDANWMGALYNFLGLSVGIITNTSSDEERKEAYSRDITYVTNNELGFDYLRDNMKYEVESRVQRGHFFAIIDEVDSILIDEARTPLIISGPVDDSTKLYVEADRIVKKLNSSDYDIDEKTKSVNLNEEGINKVEEELKLYSLINKNTSLFDFENLEFVHYINQSLKANNLFKKDVEYVVQEGQIQIIDEFTGRIMKGRRYSEGLHQAIEAKESVAIQNENQTLASITFQNYFRSYKNLSGMTGTAMTESQELKEIYKLDVVAVPPNIKSVRIDKEDEIYGTKKEKYDAILKQINECYDKGQPVLVGTVSIERSEEISDLLRKKGIKHNVLNAKYHEKEAHIIAQAGRFKAVTIATNMAGRGTDIMLGGNPSMLIEELEEKTGKSLSEDKKVQDEIHSKVMKEKEDVKNIGGLFIIATERHESRRIDNQLRGRSGRQGDPGITKFFLSLEDDLMRIFASERISNLLRKMGLKDGEAINHPMVSGALAKAQNKVEAHNFEIRKNLLKFDNVMNDQRKIIYSKRDEIIDSEDFDELVNSLSCEAIEEIVGRNIPKASYREEWDIDELKKELLNNFGIIINEEDIKNGDQDDEDIIKFIQDEFNNILKLKDEKYGKHNMDKAKKYIMLDSLDQVWKDHLHSLDHLRQGISLRAYGQKDPLIEYKKESFTLFEVMLDNLRDKFIQNICHLKLDTQNFDNTKLDIRNKSMQNISATRNDPAFEKYNSGSSIQSGLKPSLGRVDPKDRKANDPSSWGKVSRNEPCPCGSMKKYKHCHGKII